MAIACDQAGLRVERQRILAVWFRGIKVGDFRADIVVEDKILLELKAARAIERSHEAQLLHYLRSSEIEVGLLLNFGLRAQFRRLVFANERKKPGTADFAEYPDKADHRQFATDFTKKESA